MKAIKTPTGYILLVDGQNGTLETVSQKRVTSPFDETDEVKTLSLAKRWTINLSTQYGCLCDCVFCDVPRVRFKGNASYADMVLQIKSALNIYPNVTQSDHLDVYFARMGEPTKNMEVIRLIQDLRQIVPSFAQNGIIRPMVSTMMPKCNDRLMEFLNLWSKEIANKHYKDQAVLQISIHSTNEKERSCMFNGHSLPLSAISKMLNSIKKPIGRKYVLNFAVSTYEIDPSVLLRYFDPKLFLIKLTTMSDTFASLDNGLTIEIDEDKPCPYKTHKEKLEKAGYDVLVFIASHHEEKGRVTCGNAQLFHDRRERLFKEAETIELCAEAWKKEKK